MSNRRKRRENLITALLIAGMCIVIATTIIIIVKISTEEKDADATSPSSDVHTESVARFKRGTKPFEYRLIGEFRRL